MEKFFKACVILILILLIYLIFRSEKFIASVTDTIRAKDFNFKNDRYGNSGADYYLASQLHN